MSDNNITHAAVYCPACGAKVRYQFPAGASDERRSAILGRAMAAHFIAADHAPAESFALEIEAEGLPRNVGPFPSREAATAWMDSKQPFTGSWHVIPLTAP